MRLPAGDVRGECVTSNRAPYGEPMLPAARPRVLPSCVRLPRASVWQARPGAWVWAAYGESASVYVGHDVSRVAALNAARRQVGVLRSHW